MIVFRLSSKMYAQDLSGKGAEKYGGRWNSKGIPMLYTCQSIALTTLEIAVHTPLGNIPSNYQLISIQIPDKAKILELPLEQLSTDWKSFPHSRSTQELGDQFIHSGDYLALKVPSAVVVEEWNYLINPNHPEIKKIKIRSVAPFSFDERLFIR